MKFYCIDDDQYFLTKFKENCINFSIKNNIDIKTYTLSNIPKEVPSDADAYFLDIEIYDDTIFEFIQKIREIDQFVPIVIITNYDNYVLDSVKFNIFDFIRKNYFEREIQQTMNRLIVYLDSILPTISFKSEGKEIKIKIKDIIFVESFSHETILHTINQEYYVKKDTKYIFNDYIKYLIKIHRSYYVNPAYIKHLSSDYVHLFNDVSLPIGKKYIHSLKHAIFNK